MLSGKAMSFPKAKLLRPDSSNPYSWSENKENPKTFQKILTPLRERTLIDRTKNGAVEELVS